MRVLVVDDNDDARELVCLMVQQGGDEPLPVACADDALAVLDSADAMLTDYCMPEKDGLRLAKETMLRRPGFPVVVFTGVGKYDEAERALQAGVLDWLEKPLTPEAIADVLTRARGKNARSAFDRLSALTASTCAHAAHFSAALLGVATELARRR